MSSFSIYRSSFMKFNIKNIDFIMHTFKCLNPILAKHQRSIFENKWNTRISKYCTATSRDISPIEMVISTYKHSSNFDSSLPPVIIMHGLFESKNNYKSLGNAIKQKTERIVYLVDARNHGKSPHTTEFDYYCLAEDIMNFLEERSLSKACLIGHGMGGRAAMTVALHNPAVVEKLFVLDISPIGISDAVSSLPDFVEIMRKLNIPDELELHQARKLLDSLLIPVVPEARLRLILMENLKKSRGKFWWSLNLETIAEKFHPHISTFPPAKDGKPFQGETYFIGGSLSNCIKKTDHDEIRNLFPKAKFSYIDGSGHWLHNSKPKDLLDAIVPLIT